MKKVTYEDLTSEILHDTKLDILIVNKDDENFYFKFRLKPGNSNLVVFSNGAVDFSKSKPPVFSRSSWYEDYDANCIFVDDKTIHGTDCTLGWGVGTLNRYYLKDYSEIIKKFVSLLGIKENRVIYFGSSAGGFMSMMLSTLHKDTMAIVNNPQVYAHRFGSGSQVKKLYNSNFPGLTAKEIHERYGYRFSLTNLISKQRYVPKILYIQNRSFTPDMEKQYEAFLSKMDLYNIDDSNIEFLLYSDKNSGHNPISRKKTADVINSYFNSML